MSERYCSQGHDEPFRIYARGPQSWEFMDVSVVDGRIELVIDASIVHLTRIQSEELTRWLAERLP